MKRIYLLAAFIIALQGLNAQSNISLTSSEAENILTGNYDPASYQAGVVITDHRQIICELDNSVSTDSLKAYLEVLETFQTRHTYSDTVSPIHGIGAARRWVYSKFKQFRSRNDNRLIPAYLEFDRLAGLCGDGLGFKNVLGVLPGTDTTDPSVIILEAHMDSRCESNCDTSCYAPGMDDNGSGTALVMELARVMSRYSFKHTLVFMLTVGEEQGLYGADAMSLYCLNNNVSVRAVQNNDVIGGVICGATSSPPSCPFEDHIDSTHVRLFSHGNFAFEHRSFARTIKMYNEEKLSPISSVPMTINIIGQEDRVGRGGDHIPFRQDGFRNVRFTSANEHGHGAPGAGYTDRQHTVNDILGIDTDNDNAIDSFYVDLNYLRRNAMINGSSATLLAQGPDAPGFILHDEPGGLRVEITSLTSMPEFRVGMRTTANIEFEQVYSFSGTSFVIPGQVMGSNYFVSVAAIDGNQIMGPFTAEQRAITDANTASAPQDSLPHKLSCASVGIKEIRKSRNRALQLLPCTPNPLLDYTNISVRVSKEIAYGEAVIKVKDSKGVEVASLPIVLKPGESTIRYEHQGASGVYYYSLVVDRQVIKTMKMIVE